MAKLIPTVEKEGSCITLKDGRPSKIKAYLFKDISYKSPTEDYDNYMKLLEQGATSQSFYTITFNCVGCNLCKPLRINLNNFSPSKHQNRLLKKNRDLSFEITGISTNNEHFGLYKKYTANRHPNSPMNGIGYEDFKRRLNSCTHLGLLKNKGTLVGFTVFKQHKDAITYEYAVYDPDLQKRSLGTALGLKLIGYAQKQGIKHMYLGEINLESQVFKYKAQYEGSEIFNRATKKWVPIERNPVSLDHIP